MAEGLGQLAGFELTEGQASDKACAPRLLADLPAAIVVADRGYDWQALIDALTARGIEAVIPPCSRNRVGRARPYDRIRYQDRNLIERLFCQLKHFRRIATRYDKLAERYSSFIAAVASLLWLR